MDGFLGALSQSPHEDERESALLHQFTVDDLQITPMKDENALGLGNIHTELLRNSHQ